MNSRIFSLGILSIGVLFAGAGCVSFSGNDAAANGPAGVFVSLDAGEKWQHISLLPQAEGVKTLSDASVYRLVEDPEDTQALYWASRERGLLYSYDNGKSWHQAAAPLNTGFVYSVAVHPKDKCTIFATPGSVVYRSDDCSRSWTDIQLGLNQSERVASIAFNPFNPANILLAKSSGDLLQSFDGGKSWSVQNRFNARVEHVAFDELQSGVIYVATRDAGLFRSVDGGKTWGGLMSVLKDFSGAKEYRRFIIHPTRKDTIYWISTYGILVSKDRGDSWEPMRLIDAPGSASIYAFVINPKNEKEIFYTASVGGTSVLYHSVDEGVNWRTKRLPSGQMPTALRVHPEGNILYVGFTIPPKQ